MTTRILHRWIIVGGAVLLVTSAVARTYASPVAIVNPSFENPATGGFTPIANAFPAHSGLTMTATANDWTYVGPADTTGTTSGNQSITGNGMTLGTGQGTDALYINNGPNSNNNNSPQYILQDVGGITAAGTAYSLTVAYANRSGFGIGATGRIALYEVPQTGGGVGAAVTDEITAAPPSAANDPAWATWFGTATLLSSTDEPVQSDNAFHDFTVNYTSAAGDVGNDLLIVLTQTADASAAQRQANFDNVRLNTVPEPTSLFLLGIGSLGLIVSARRLRRA